MQDIFIAAESVRKGHPDKMADFISDKLVDYCISQDKNAKCAFEVMLAYNNVFLCGESSISISDEIGHKIVHDALHELKYTYDPIIQVKIQQQSQELSEISKNDLSGDQCIVHGWACYNQENELYYPTINAMAHDLCMTIDKYQKIYQTIHSDGKVMIIKNHDNTINKIITSIHHSKDYDKNHVKDFISQEMQIDKDLLFVNHAMTFEQGGPQADTGLTGRKIMIDAYGQSVVHGGGCYSGKDCTKMDRSGAYIARWIAKNISKALKINCGVSLVYNIGINKPCKIYFFNVEGYDTSSWSNILLNNIDLSMPNILHRLELRSTKFAPICNYSHYYKKDTPWERLDIYSQVHDLLISSKI